MMTDDSTKPRLTYRQQLKLLQEQAKTEVEELEAVRRVAAQAEALEERRPRRSRRKSSSKENTAALEDAAAAAAAAGDDHADSNNNNNMEMNDGDQQQQQPPPFDYENETELNVGSWTEATMPTTSNKRKRRTIKVKMTVRGIDSGVNEDAANEDDAVADSKPESDNKLDDTMIGDQDLDGDDDDDDDEDNDGVVAVDGNSKQPKRLEHSLDDDDDQDDENEEDRKQEIFKRIRKIQVSRTAEVKKPDTTKKSDKSARVSPNPNSIPRRKVVEATPAAEEAKTADTAPLLTKLMEPLKQPLPQQPVQPITSSSSHKGSSNAPRGGGGGGNSGGFKRPPTSAAPRQQQHAQPQQVINIDALPGPYSAPSQHNVPSHSMPTYNTGPWTLSEEEKDLLQSLERYCSKLGDNPQFHSPQPPTRSGNTNTIDLSGSFLRSNDNSKTDLDFFDLDESGAILIPKKIPIFPEDFPPGMPEWPLAWWGIVDPALAELEPKPAVVGDGKYPRSDRRTPPPYSAVGGQQQQQRHSGNFPQHGPGGGGFGGRGGGGGWDGGRMDRGGGPPAHGRPNGGGGGGRGPPPNWQGGREGGGPWSGGGPPPDDWFGRNQGPPPPYEHSMPPQQRNRR